MPVDASEALLCWYAVDKRRLPWRAEARRARPTPIGSGCREVMLQQTTVAAVKPYFEAFTAPLADGRGAGRGRGRRGDGRLGGARLLCPRPQPARLRPRRWRRAWRRLPRHRGGAAHAARASAAYTAAAIAAIAFGRRAVVVDGNVERVVARLLRGRRRRCRGAAARSRALADAMTPDEGAGDFAQAMMDLGADHLHAAQRPIAAAARSRRLVRGLCGGRSGAFIRSRRRRPPGRSARASLTGSSMTARSCSSAGPARGLLGGMLALPEATARRRGLAARPARSTMSSPISRSPCACSAPSADERPRRASGGRSSGSAKPGLPTLFAKLAAPRRRVAARRHEPPPRLHRRRPRPRRPSSARRGAAGRAGGRRRRAAAAARGLDPVLDEEGGSPGAPLDGGERRLIFLGLTEGAPFSRRWSGSSAGSAPGPCSAALADGARGCGDLGRGAEPDRMAHPPRLLRPLRPRRREPSAPAGGANARIAAPSISRASIRS